MSPSSPKPPATPSLSSSSCRTLVTSGIPGYPNLSRIKLYTSSMPKLKGYEGTTRAPTSRRKYRHDSSSKDPSSSKGGEFLKAGEDGLAEMTRRRAMSGIMSGWKGMMAERMKDAGASHTVRYGLPDKASREMTAEPWTEGE